MKLDAKRPAEEPGRVGNVTIHLTRLERINVCRFVETGLKFKPMNVMTELLTTEKDAMVIVQGLYLDGNAFLEISQNLLTAL